MKKEQIFWYISNLDESQSIILQTRSQFQMLCSVQLYSKAFSIKQNYRHGDYISGCQRVGWGKDEYKQIAKELWGDEELFCVLIISMGMSLLQCIKIHKAAHLKKHTF